MSPRARVLALVLTLLLASACKRKSAEAPGADAEVAPVPSGPIRVENVLGLELTLPAPWMRSKAEPDDAASGVLLRARRPAPGGGLGVAPSLVIERPAAGELEDVLAEALRSLEALENKAGVELEKTSTGQHTLGGRSFRALEASYRVGPSGDKGVRLVKRSYFLEAPDGPPGARVLGFHFTHLAEHAEALGTELDVVLSGIELTGPRLAAPGASKNSEVAPAREEQ